jgi:hypothetical protein
MTTARYRQAPATFRYLLDRMGGERFLDPQLVLLDLAMLHYYHVLRVQGWIGDFALHLEHLFFGSGAFAAEYRDLPPGTRRAAEDGVRRLGEQLMPLLDRANRMFIRNVKAIKELRQGSVPAIAIGRAERVTVQQTGRRRLLEHRLVFFTEDWGSSAMFSSTP